MRRAVERVLARIAAAELPGDVVATVEADRVMLTGPRLAERRIADARLRGFGGVR